MRISLLLAGLALLAGCAEFVARPIDAAASAAQFESRSLRDAGLQTFVQAGLHREATPWPPAAWDLETLTLAALYYHSDMALARAQLETAKAGEITAAQRPNPSISFSPTYVTHITSAPFNPYILGLNPDIPIETAGKRDHRIEHAQYLTAAVREKIATAAWQVRSRLRASLLNLYGARRTQALRAEQLAQQETLVRLLEKRRAVGELSRPEVAPARLALHQSELALGEAHKQAADATAQLAEAIGLPAAALAGAEISFDALERRPVLETLPAGKLRQQALFNRADVLGALADYEASQAALQLEVAKQYPDLRLGPGVIYNQGEYKWVLGASLTLPILNQNQGPIAEAEARRREAAARFEALQARIAGEVERSYAGALAVQHKLAQAQAWLDTQGQQRRFSEALFQAGESDRPALAVAQLDYAATALARLDALLKAQQALGWLEDALQRPLDGSMPPPAAAGNP